MSKFHLQYKSEQRWASAQKVTGLADLQHYVTTLNILKAEKNALSTQLENFIEEYKKIPVSMQEDNIMVPVARATPNMNLAYSAEDIPRDIEVMCKFLAVWCDIKPNMNIVVTELLKKVQENKNLYTPQETAALYATYGHRWDTDIDKTYKSFQKLKSMMDDERVILVEQKVENSYIEKSAWAIFAELDGNAGFLNKQANVGEISAARLFDTLKDAHNTANRLFIKHFEVMEVTISLQKRTNTKPEFQDKKMLEALAYLERGKLGDLLQDMDEKAVAQKRNKL